jgi:hypothetical protein
MKSDKDCTSKAGYWTGIVLTVTSVLFLLFDGITKIVQSDFVVKATVQIGYPKSSVFYIGLILFICTILYVIPRTSLLGAILLTGYLGGAVASNLRVGNPIFSSTLFPVYIGIFVWGGLFLRDSRLRELFPVRKDE